MKSWKRQLMYMAINQLIICYTAMLEITPNNLQCRKCGVRVKNFTIYRILLKSTTVQYEIVVKSVLSHKIIARVFW